MTRTAGAVTLRCLWLSLVAAAIFTALVLLVSPANAQGMDPIQQQRVAQQQMEQWARDAQQAPVKEAQAKAAQAKAWVDDFARVWNTFAKDADRCALGVQEGTVDKPHCEAALKGWDKVTHHPAWPVKGTK